MSILSGRSGNKGAPAGNVGVKGNPPSTSTASWDEQTEALLQDWHNRAMAAKTAHYKLATRLRRRNVMLGIPAVIFSSIVGTSLFATLTEEKVNTSLRIVIGGISVAAAIFSALQTFLRFSERAEKHVLAADWYSAVRRDIAQMLALPPEARDKPKEALDRVRREMNKIGQQSPEIGEHLWSVVARECGVDDPAVSKGP